MSNAITETKLKKSRKPFQFTIELSGTLFFPLFSTQQVSLHDTSLLLSHRFSLVQAASEPIIPVALPLSSDMVAHGG